VVRPSIVRSKSPLSRPVRARTGSRLDSKYTLTGLPAGVHPRERSLITPVGETRSALSCKDRGLGAGANRSLSPNLDGSPSAVQRVIAERDCPISAASMAFDVTTLTAASAWALAIGTVVLLWWQVRVSQHLNSANAVLTLRERFDSPAVRRRRKVLAERLLQGRHDDITNLEVAAFFELIGSLTHARVLNRELVWEAFGTWISGYYVALRSPVDVIGRARTALKDPLIMHEFEWLFGLIEQMDRKRIGAETNLEEATREESASLLRREAELELD